MVSNVDEQPEITVTQNPNDGTTENNENNNDCVEFNESDESDILDARLNELANSGFHLNCESKANDVHNIDKVNKKWTQ